MYSIEEFDIQKSKIMKYIIFKKRTEGEVRKKFENAMPKELLNDIIEHIKEAGYLDDRNYIKKAIREFVTLKNLSIKEIKYKLYSKGIDKGIIDDYVDENIDELIEYEKQAARRIVDKKILTTDIEKIKLHLLNKGYKKCSIEYANEGRENC